MDKDITIFSYWCAKENGETRVIISDVYISNQNGELT